MYSSMNLIPFTFQEIVAHVIFFLKQRRENIFHCHWNILENAL
jgi:hypothetical protein